MSLVEPGLRALRRGDGIAALLAAPLSGVDLDLCGSTDGIAIGGYDTVPYSPLAGGSNLVDIHCVVFCADMGTSIC